MELGHRKPRHLIPINQLKAEGWQPSVAAGGLGSRYAFYRGNAKRMRQGALEGLARNSAPL
jgi:hypothetical protein